MKSIILMTLIATAVMGLNPLSASAEEYNYVGDNHSWALTCNKSGYVLRSQYPVTRFHEDGAGSSVSNEIETIYLGRSCDASNTHLGEGTWCWANGGFVAEFEKNKIGFPRQELLCPKDEDEFANCRC